MVDTRSNMQLADLNSNPHGGKIHIDFIDPSIGTWFYLPPWSEQYKLIQLDQFHVPSYINNNH